MRKDSPRPLRISFCLKRLPPLSLLAAFGVQTKTLSKFRTFVFFATFRSNSLRSLLFHLFPDRLPLLSRLPVFSVQTKTPLKIPHLRFATFCSNSLRSLLFLSIRLKNGSFQSLLDQETYPIQDRD